MNYRMENMKSFSYVYQGLGLKVIFLVSVIFTLIACKRKPKEPIDLDVKKPNILMIAVDDLNGYLGYLGHPSAITPNIDRLAASGVAFINAHCQAPLCGPSRASVMTGRRPSTTGIYGMIKDDSIKTGSPELQQIKLLPEYFRERGYNTMGVGKIFHNYAPDGVFDIAAGRFSGEKPNHNFGPKPQERIVWEGYAKENPELHGRTSTDWGAFPDKDSRMPDFENTQWAINQLRAYSSNDPFFLAIGYLRPHVPLHVPKKWFDMYPLENIELPPYLKTDFDDIPEIAKNKVTYLPMMPSTDWAIKTNNWKKIVQAYLACVSFVDNEVGKLLKALEKSKYSKNTIVIFWSDHGYRVGEKGTFAKHSLWEEATRTPLIVSGPGIPLNKEIDSPVELLSIYPTLLDLSGLPPNIQNEGANLVPLINGRDNGETMTALTTYGWSNHSIRTKDYRYIKYEDGSEELYKKTEDPNEFNNLADKQEFSNIKDSLRELLPKNNVPWHKDSFYRMTPYLKDQKERVNSKTKEPLAN